MIGIKGDDMDNRFVNSDVFETYVIKVRMGPANYIGEIELARKDEYYKSEEQRSKELKTLEKSAISTRKLKKLLKKNPDLRNVVFSLAKEAAEVAKKGPPLKEPTFWAKVRRFLWL